MPSPSIPLGQLPHKNSVSVIFVHVTASLKQGYTSGSKHGSREMRNVGYVFYWASEIIT